MIHEVREAREKLNAAELEFHSALKDAFPVGANIEFKHGNHWRQVTVLDHYGDRLRVRGYSGKVYVVNWNHTFEIA